MKFKKNGTNLTKFSILYDVMGFTKSGLTSQFEIYHPLNKHVFCSNIDHVY